MQRDQSEVEKIAKYYDFIEVQPPKLYQDLIDRELIRDTETLYEIYDRILKAGESILVGTACDEGELFAAVMQRDQSEVEKIAKYYDF
ncbi:hypothetical protein BUE67_15225, partial [Corynebacterium diphtheriae]